MLSLNGGAGSGADAGARTTPRKNKAVMAMVDRVMEVCNVTSDEAHRVLTDCDMDVQRTIERFVSGTLCALGLELVLRRCAGCREVFWYR